MTREDEIADVAYLPNGELNASYILANAKILLREGELPLAISLFLLVKDHKKLGHCAHYGIGQCFFAAKDWEHAVQAFEKALSVARKPYIAIALMYAMIENKQYSHVERLALQFAREFSLESKFIEEVRKIYQSSIDYQKVDS